MERFAKQVANERGVANPSASAPSNRSPLAQLLDDVEAFCRRFLASLDDAHFVVLALFVAHTHVIEATDTTPYIHVVSAEAQSGKTRVLEVLELLVAKPEPMLDPTAASLFRSIDSGEVVTVLIDEVDNFLVGGKADGDGKRSVLALLNGGYRRGLTVPRVRDRTGAIDRFVVFCPKVIAGLASLPDTLASRSLRFVIRRRRKDERIERFRRRRVAPPASLLRERFEAWATEEVIATLVDADPELPDELSDRQQDACEALVAIADIAGGTWPTRGRQALKDLVRVDRADQSADSLGTQLLADLQETFRIHGSPIATATILEHLNSLDERPWAGKTDRASRRGPWPLS